MRNCYQHVTATLSRFAAIARADEQANTASEAANLLTAGGVRKDNGKEYSAHDVRMFRSVNRDITKEQRLALTKAHLTLLGGES